jgi:hypothetical protein
MAPQVGLEPTTNRLTADCSTTELLRNNNIPSKADLQYLKELILIEMFVSLSTLHIIRTSSSIVKMKLSDVFISEAVRFITLPAIYPSVNSFVFTNVPLHFPQTYLLVLIDLFLLYC